MSQIAGWQFPIRLTLGLGSSAMHGTAIAI
jgi:hypothetical protein